MRVRVVMVVLATLAFGCGMRFTQAEEGIATIADDPSSVPANTHYKLTRVGEYTRLESRDVTKSFRTELSLSLMKPEIFDNGVQSLGVLARHNAARVEAVRNSLPEQLQGLADVVDPQKVRIFLHFKPSKDQPTNPRDGLRFYVVPEVDCISQNKGHLHATPGSESKYWEVWRYQGGRFILEQAASSWGVTIL
jgi:hypothetical protein